MYHILVTVVLLYSINEVYASLYELIQSNDSWEESCKTIESSLSILNGTDNVTTPDLPGNHLCV